MTNPRIDDVFDRLDQWRHLPKYQLERRADIYFALCLPRLLKEHFRLEAEPMVIPEFPLKKDNNQSQNADYLALTADCSRAFLIELKTDNESVEDDQIAYYVNASQKTLSELLRDLKSIAVNTESRSRLKYLCLLEVLGTQRLIEEPEARLEELRGIANKKPARGWTAGVESLMVKACDNRPEIVYLLPERSDELPQNFTQITFHEIADAIKNLGPDANRFAKSLRCWADVPAGSVPPGTPCP